MRKTVSVTMAAVAALAFGAFAPRAANATTITFNDFSNLAGLQLNGAARTIHTCDASGNTGCDAVTDNLGRQVLRLTNNYNQSGSEFSLATVSLANAASFSTAFTFRMSDIPGGSGICDEDGCGADGIVFAVQSVSNTAGGFGQGIGYSGIPNSVGIEFDSWNNGFQDDNNGNHVGIDINGNVNATVQYNIPTSGTGPVVGRLNNGSDWYGWVDYNGATDLLEVRLSMSSLRPLLPLLTHTVDLAAILGTTNAYVGFTSGTGAARNYHDIVSWQFNDDYEPIGVPAPATLTLLVPVVAGLLGLRRRRRA